MDKLTELINKLDDVTKCGIFDLTDQLEEVGIHFLSKDDAEHFYWYSDDLEYEEDEDGAYDIEDLPYNKDGTVNQQMYDELVDVINKYIAEHSK